MYQFLTDKKKFSLYLFEHIHGDSRERGTAIIDLQNLYKNYNFDISEAKELPDYIPLFLEFISLIEESTAYDMLGEIINLISIIKNRLEIINSKYSILFSILESLSIIKPDYILVEKIINKDKEIDNKSNIDKEWEEEKIF
ncbi:MAG TPA: nitrate reductase molybdenum cofactor assembly chaperone [Candidatus Azoamicus sp.]